MSLGWRAIVVLGRVALVSLAMLAACGDDDAAAEVDAGLDAALAFEAGPPPSGRDRMTASDAGPPAPIDDGGVIDPGGPFSGELYTCPCDSRSSIRPRGQERHA